MTALVVIGETWLPPVPHALACMRDDTCISSGVTLADALTETAEESTP